MTNTDKTKHDEEAAKLRRIDRGAYRWNGIATTLFALQSVIMLVVLTRVCDVYVAGVFTIAYANANLFQNVGKFGMRKFQASDRALEFNFCEYRRSRLASCAAMIAAALAYIAFSSATIGYSADKTLVMVVMCVFKAVGAFEDVFTGAYQRLGRLDIGAKMTSLRMGTTLVAFSLFIILFADLLPALCATTLYTSALLAFQVRYVRRRFDLPERTPARERGTVIRLLRECAPLFAADFLLFYMGCAPKYAIDAIMNDAMQAYYGYIAMPVFVVTLVAGFVYTPMIAKLSDLWIAGSVKAFMGRFAIITLYVVAITALCVAGAWAIGIPVLDMLYNAELSAYRTELLILVAGGGFLAIATVATLGITIVRFQKVLVPLYAALSVFAFFVSNAAVTALGITGAAWSYLAIMACAAIIFAAAFCLRVYTTTRS